VSSLTEKKETKVKFVPKIIFILKEEAKEK